MPGHPVWFGDGWLQWVSSNVSQWEWVGPRSALASTENPSLIMRQLSCARQCPRLEVFTMPQQCLRLQVTVLWLLGSLAGPIGCVKVSVPLAETLP